MTKISSNRDPVFAALFSSRYSRFLGLLPTPLFIAILLSPYFNQDSSAADRPNVLMIVVDDMNDWVACLGGHPDIKTPSIDRLAQRGLLFTNAHVAAPVCNPSRVATLTGLKPSSTGIYGNETKWLDALPDVETIPRHFKANGYHVVGGGKVNHHMPGFNRRSDWHDYIDQVFDSHYQDQLARGLDVENFTWPAGFPLNRLDAVRSFAKPPQNPNEFDWGAVDKPDRDMGDGKMVESAMKFLMQPTKQAFFFAAGIYRPHLPFYAPREYFEMYPLDKITLPSIRADDCNDLPNAGKKMAAGRRGDYELVMKEGRHRELVQAYLASITFGDALIGQLLEALNAGPAAKNTIVVLWSDHGWHLGEKQHLHKFTLWERSTRVPLIIDAPGVTTASTRTARPVGLIDIFPTLCELCTLPTVSTHDGISLVPLLQDPSREWDQPVLTTHGQGNHALRSERWRYIRYADGSEELYDHVNDPNEWTKLEAWRKDVGAEVMKPNPAYDPSATAPTKKKKRNTYEALRPACHSLSAFLGINSSGAPGRLKGLLATGSRSAVRQTQKLGLVNSSLPALSREMAPRASGNTQLRARCECIGDRQRRPGDSKSCRTMTKRDQPESANAPLALSVAVHC